MTALEKQDRSREARRLSTLSRTFSRNVRNFSKFSQVFRSFRMRLDVFGSVRTCSDTFGHIRMLGSVRTFAGNFEFFKNVPFLEMFGVNYSRSQTDLEKQVRSREARPLREARRRTSNNARRTPSNARRTSMMLAGRRIMLAERRLIAILVVMSLPGAN